MSPVLRRWLEAALLLVLGALASQYHGHGLRLALWIAAGVVALVLLADLLWGLGGRRTRASSAPQGSLPDNSEIELGRRAIRVARRAQQVARRAQQLNEKARQEHPDDVEQWNRVTDYFKGEIGGEWHAVLRDMARLGAISESERQHFEVTANVTMLTTGSATADVEAAARELLRENGVSE